MVLVAGFAGKPSGARAALRRTQSVRPEAWAVAASCRSTAIPPRHGFRARLGGRPERHLRAAC